MSPEKSKKELDRDMMFRKIMPALADNPFALPVTNPALLAPLPEGDGEDGFEALPTYDEDNDTWDEAPFVPAANPVEAPHPAPGRPRRARPSPVFPASEAARPLEEEDDTLSLLRTKLFARSESPAHAGQVSTVNLMESLVLRYLDEVILRFNCCPCDRCRRDVAAYALNQLPPQYVMADACHLDEGEDTRKQVFDALIKAVLQVRSHPTH